MLQNTVDVRDIATPGRTMVVVNPGRKALAPALADRRDREIILQPKNRGTVLGIVLPFALTRGRDPDAPVAIFPFDRFVPRPQPYLEGARAGGCR